ncbi:MAG: hypothetical protein HYZ28_07915 [Myxococcales bacterium]|nr:hypothetical protein [Myxococcales bacterium]
MTETSWIPGLVVLVAGLMAGLLFVLVNRRGGKAAALPTEDRRADLDQRYRQLIGQLKELNADRHLLGEERFLAERARLEREAADALRARDGLVKERPAAAKEPARALAADQPRSSALKGAAIAFGAVGFFVVVGLLLSQESKPKVDARPPAGPPPTEPREENPHLAAALDALERDPEDRDALVGAAHELIRTDQFDRAGPFVERALAMDPYHVETRIHRAVLMAAQGKMAAALAQLEHLADTYPGAYEARLFASGIAAQLGDGERAAHQLERFAKEAPLEQHPPMLQKAIQSLRGPGGKAN